LCGRPWRTGAAVADPALQQRLRLALSWRAEAKRLLIELDAASRAGNVARDRYKRLHATYQEHLEKATAAIAAIRAEETPALERLARHLRECLAREEAIAGQIKAGTIAHKTANAERARLSGEVAALRAAISDYNQLLSADRAEKLGGQITLKLDEYEARVMSPVSRQDATGKKYLSRQDLLVILLSAAVILVGVTTILMMQFRGRSVQWSVAGYNQPEKILVLRCRNTTLRSAQLHVPWTGESATGGRSDFGVFVYLKSADSSEFKRVQSTAAWYSQGVSAVQNAPHEVLAGLDREFMLQLWDLGPIVRNADAVRVDCTTGTGKVIFSSTHPLTPSP